MALVLAYRALGLGDFLTGVPAYRALARAFPEHRLVLAAPAALSPLADLTGVIDTVFDTAPLGPAPAGADIAVNLHGRGPQSHEVLRAARPKRLIAFGVDGIEWRADEHEVHRWCRLLEEAGIPADPTELALTPPDAPGAGGATVIHPGAASASRRWPADRWIEIARHELAGGRPVVITGGPDERALAERIAAAAPPSLVLAGRTDLLRLAATVASAGRVICGDTGVAHLATAFGTPSVVLFGPTPPSEWGPPAGARHLALWTGRRGDPHGAEPDPGLLQISVCDVIDALGRLPLGSTAA